MNDQPLPLTPERIAVVVPALNEALRIRDVVQGALRHCPNVIVVDDGSDDGTADAIADLPVTLLRHASR
ncbi:MAG TPA: glycosyltransferase, partial [Thermomonas sp.]|nr:glycosyltransferase [Thermomonas sp.]